MSKQVTIDKNDLQELIIDAQRYAIGRMTMVPRAVKTIILKHLDSLTNNTIHIIMQDIELWAGRDMLGHECDKRLWLDLLAKLKAEIEKRGENEY